MLARCVFSQGSELGDPVRGGMWSEASDYSGVVAPERDYHVQGMGLFNSVLLLLIQGDEGRPDWLPAALFSVDVGNVPADWQFALVDARAAGGASEPDGWQAIWGYPELVRDPRHSDALIERDVAALRIFDARRAAALEADPG